MRDLRQKAYQNTTWRKTRETYLRLHPLCEECLKKGKVTPATSIHHKESPFKGGEVNYTLLTDFNNLESICHECHGEIHSKGKVDNPEETYNYLKSLLPDDKHKEDN